MACNTGYVRMAVIPNVQRSAQGSKSHSVYNFNPLACVEQMDVEDFLSYFYKKGCACNGNQETLPLFAREEDILSGKVVPAWAGQYSAPIPCPEWPRPCKAPVSV